VLIGEIRVESSAFSQCSFRGKIISCAGKYIFHEIRRNHRRWHHGVDGGVLSETQGHAGHGL
jgi:hypothetical protein